jgi:hypothetical protein
MTRLALILSGGALALWFAFDRVWPRLPAAIFVRVELALLVAACVTGTLGWRRERTRGSLATLAAALAGLGLYATVAALRLRYTP